MNREVAEHGAYIRERCLCGAEFEAADGGWYKPAPRRKNDPVDEFRGDPTVEEWHKAWRTEHPCTVRS